MLSQLPKVTDPNLLVGTETGDDAAVYRLRDDLALVQTVDFFPPVVDDPYRFGAVAAANALSDIYAMGGTPLLGLNIVAYPIDLPKEFLVEILQGGYDKAAEAGLLIVGGHTIDDKEPKYGLAVTGLLRPGDQVTNAGAQEGDLLVLTKPIGTGIITTAGKQDEVDKEVLEGALESMEMLNRGASAAMLHAGVHACTDVTGFGAAGPPPRHGTWERRWSGGAPLPGAPAAGHLGACATGDSPGRHPPQPEVVDPPRAVGPVAARGGQGGPQRCPDLGRPPYRCGS